MVAHKINEGQIQRTNNFISVNTLVGEFANPRTVILSHARIAILFFINSIISKYSAMIIVRQDHCHRPQRLYQQLRRQLRPMHLLCQQHRLRSLHLDQQHARPSCVHSVHASISVNNSVITMCSHNTSVFVIQSVNSICSVKTIVTELDSAQAVKDHVGDHVERKPELDNLTRQGLAANLIISNWTLRTHENLTWTTSHFRVSRRNSSTRTGRGAGSEKSCL